VPAVQISVPIMAAIFTDSGVPVADVTVIVWTAFASIVVVSSSILVRLSASSP